MVYLLFFKLYKVGIFDDSNFFQTTSGTIVCMLTDIYVIWSIYFSGLKIVLNKIIALTTFVAIAAMMMKYAFILIIPAREVINISREKFKFELGIDPWTYN